MIVQFEPKVSWEQLLVEKFVKKYEGEMVQGLMLVAVTEENVYVSIDSDSGKMTELLGAVEYAKSRILNRL